MRALVMLPTYNERENVRGVVEAIFGQDPALDILVVDDSSPDGTGDIADDIARSDGRVHVLHRRERGRGTAGYAGFRWAADNGYDYVVEMDADLSHDPKYIADFKRLQAGCDVVVGSRYVPGGGTEGWSFARRIISWVANSYVRLVLGLKVRDCTGGFKMFRVEALKAIGLDRIYSDKSIYDGPETLLRIVKGGFTVKETPIVFHERAAGRSKITAKTIIRNIINHARLRIILGGA